MNEKINVEISKEKVVFYRKSRPLLFSIMGVIHLSLFAIPSGFSLIHLPIPIVLFAFAVSSYKKVALSFSDGVLKHKAIFGPTVKSYRYSSLSDFIIDKQALYLIKKGRVSKVCSLWLLDINSLSVILSKKAE